MAVKQRASVRKVRQVDLAQTIYKGLCKEITTGKLKPGQPVSRRQIAQQYGTSYTPVVEAMVRLESVGLVMAETAQVARVRRVTMETIRDLYVMLEANETQAIRLACETATAEEISELYTLAEAVETRIAQRDETDMEGLSLHWQFHKKIAQLSRVPALVREQERSELLVRYQDTWLVTARFMDDPPRWHARLVDAIQGRDPLVADAVMRAHVRRGQEKQMLAYRKKLTE